MITSTEDTAIMVREEERQHGFLATLATLPWWADILLAVGAYALFRALSGIDITVSPGATGLAALTPKHLVRALATIAQYVVPLALLVAAAVSLVQQFKK